MEDENNKDDGKGCFFCRDDLPGEIDWDRVDVCSCPPPFALLHEDYMS